MACTETRLTTDSMAQIAAWLNTQPMYLFNDVKVGCLNVEMYRHLYFDPAASLTGDPQSQGTGIMMQSEAWITWGACFSQ
jgi:hypothetical protein